MKKTLLTTTVLVIVLTTSLATEVRASRAFTDFENGSEYWTTSTQAGGIARISTTYARSGTHSLEQLSYSSGSEIQSSVASIKLPITSTLEQYELSVWVYVTERNDASARSFFGFAYDDELLGWDVWGTQGSYLWKHPFAQSQVSYGLTINTWHQIKVVAYIDSGRISIWLDENLIVDNQSAFNAGEHPTHYYIDTLANYDGVFTAHHFIDDISVSEPTETPFWVQWWFWAIVILSIVAVPSIFTTFYYRQKTLKSKETRTVSGSSASKEYIICPNCKAQLPADSKFCGKCGTSLE